MNTRVLAYLQLHIAVLLYGLTAILGDLISLSAMSLVWWRVLITSLSLLGFVGLGRRILRMERRLVLRYIAIGFLVAMHWLSFYGAIKYANASIVLAAMATTSLFTSLVEPLITKRPFRRLELVLGFLVIPPMILIARNIELSMQLGLWVALLSAFLASVFASLNKKYVDKAGPFEISFIEMASAWVFITLLMPVFSQEMGRLMPLPQDWIYLLILSLMCTTFAYVISMKALKHVTAFDANLVINLEPVYGIFLAILILKEHQELDPRFYYGVVLIMLIVFAHPMLQRKIYGRKKV
ncbi:MAG: DMT family transporter [Saprospiraceae bacterium]|jgi:drug/metabolite transporter (DMT)-like permease